MCSLDEQILSLQEETRTICEQFGVSYEALKSLRHLPPSQAAQILKISRIGKEIDTGVMQW